MAATSLASSTIAAASRTLTSTYSLTDLLRAASATAAAGSTDDGMGGMSMSMGMGTMSMGGSASATSAPMASDGMTMDAGMMMEGTCQVSMLWNWDTINACFLSESWQIRSRGAFAALCVGVILLVVLLEFLRRVAKTYDRYLIREHYKTVTLTAAPSSLAFAHSSLAARPSSSQSASSGSLMQKVHEQQDHENENGLGGMPILAVPASLPFRPSVAQQGARALLHTLQFATAYWIMLLAMYYNGYIIISVIIGAFIGYFIFQWERIGPPRLRRKKCDEARPVCVACLGLEIDCHYSDAKPEWLDGGAREKQKADELKAMVKQKAMERRERRWAGLPPVMAAESNPSPPPPSAPQAAERQADQVMGGMGNLRASSEEEESAGTTVSSTSTSTSDSASTTPGTAWNDASSPYRGGGGGGGGEATPSSTTHSSSPPGSSAGAGVVPDRFPENKSEMEVTFTMVYLDYVVPFLFPFYRPCLLESSRGWMLVLLMKNRALFHTALSLASWLYAVVLDGAEIDANGGTPGTHEVCKRANWAELQVQQEIAIKALHEDIASLNARGVANAFRDAVGCMQSIIQLLCFEVTMANTENWQSHHDAAVVLFDQVIEHHAEQGSAASGSSSSSSTVNDAPTTTTIKPWHSILDRLAQPGFVRIPIGRSGRQILSSDQSAYRFYTAYLLYIDIIAATATGTVPRLQGHHAELLAADGDGPGPAIRLNEYLGCHSWAMLELAAVAELAAWKRAQQSRGSLSVLELAHRACAIAARIRRQMDTLDDVTCTGNNNNNNNTNTNSIIIHDDPSGHPPTTPFSGGFPYNMVPECEARAAPAMALHTRIWAQATLTYLLVIVSGLNPALPEIQDSVRATVELFRALSSPSLALRTLVWPFAVTGCLALPEQEDFFVRLVDDMGGLKIFGTVNEALSIMRNIWAHRGDCFLDPQMCDIATCFTLLGRCSLLV
ncbi:fungal-specific transcription factor domain-containing protein [Xylariaceae sp. FL0594]|nr:fungal-specific transcription factor domain-containing protein [Xylariaceae sp. FL0594]